MKSTELHYLQKKSRHANWTLLGSALRFQYIENVFITKTQWLTRCFDASILLDNFENIFGLEHLGMG